MSAWPAHRLEPKAVLINAADFVALQFNRAQSQSSANDDTELKLIAAIAMIGLNSKLNTG